MTTVVNNPGGATDGGSGMGIVLGVIVAIIAIGLFVVYGLPAMTGTPANQNGSTNVNVSLPNTGGSTSTPTPAPAPSGGVLY